MSGLGVEGLSLDAVEATEAALRGEDVNVVFAMPDGQRHRHTFPIGQTVEYLKSALDTEYDIPFPTIKLYLNDQLMPDPLSLNDFPAIDAKKDVVIKVVIDESAGADEDA